MKINPLLLLVSCFFCIDISHAQGVYDFLNLDASPAASALAGSTQSSKTDPNILFYNPAGTYDLEESPASFSYLRHVTDIGCASLAYSSEFESLGRLTGAVRYINYGNFTGADEYGNRTGDFSAGEAALYINYSREVSSTIRAGANVKFIYSSIADRSSTGIAADLGLRYLPEGTDWDFGLSFLNLGGEISSYYSSKEGLAKDLRLGFSKGLKHLPFKFSFAMKELNRDKDQYTGRFERFLIGAEFKLSKVLGLKFGYDNQSRREYKIGGTSGLAGFNIGVGLKISAYSIDYAYSSLGSVGAISRIGITTNL